MDIQFVPGDQPSVDYVHPLEEFALPSVEGITSDALIEFLEKQISCGVPPFDNARWREIQALVDSLEPSFLVETLECYSCTPAFHFLLQLFLYSGYSLPCTSQYTYELARRGVQECFSQIDLRHCPKRERIVELFIHRFSRDTFNFFLQSIRMDVFIEKAFYCFSEYPFECWPNKGKVLVSFLEILTEEKQIALVQELCTLGEEEKTKEVGLLFWKAFLSKRTCATETYGHVAKIQKYLPSIREHSLERLFDLPFPVLKREIDCPENMRYVSFSCDKNVVFYGKFAIGMCHKNCDYRDERKVVVAFDVTSGAIVWAVATNQTEVRCSFTKMGLMLYCLNHSIVAIYHPENGRLLTDCLQLPTGIQKGNQIDVLPNGILYLHERRENQVFVHSRNVETREKPCVRTYENKLDSFCKNGNLYCIEETKDAYFLTVQTLDDTKSIRVVLEGRHTLCDVCDDGMVIAICSDQVVFIDPENKTIYPTKGQVSKQTSTFVDTKTSSLWIWNKSDQMVWKHTKETSQCMGKLPGRNRQLLHVDEKGILYFS